jgi:hypothetical protein
MYSVSWKHTYWYSNKNVCPKDNHLKYIYWYARKTVWFCMNILSSFYFTLLPKFEICYKLNLSIKTKTVGLIYTGLIVILIKQDLWWRFRCKFSISVIIILTHIYYVFNQLWGFIINLEYHVFNRMHKLHVYKEILVFVLSLIS